MPKVFEEDDDFLNELVEMGIIEHNIENDILCYKESRQYIKNLCLKIVKWSKGLNVGIGFENNVLDLSKLINQIENTKELSVRSSSFRLDHFTNLEGKEEAQIMIRGNDAKNYEYERLMGYITRTEARIFMLKTFEKHFNSLNEVQKKIIFYHFVKGEKNDKISEKRVPYCITALCTIKKGATNYLAKNIELDLKNAS